MPLTELGQQGEPVLGDGKQQFCSGQVKGESPSRDWVGSSVSELGL